MELLLLLFIYEKFVACGEFGLAYEYPIHFGEGDS
jgi:hypothetical protein